MLVDINTIKHVSGERFEVNDIILKPLINDIKTNGMLQPIQVTPDLRIIDGRKRIKACQEIGYKQVDIMQIDINEYEKKLINEVQHSLIRESFNRTKQIELIDRFRRIVKVRADKTFNGVTYDHINDVESAISKFVMNQSVGQFKNARKILEEGSEYHINWLNTNNTLINTVYKNTGFTRQKQANPRSKKNTINNIKSKERSCNFCNEKFYSIDTNMTCVDCMKFIKEYKKNMKYHNQPYNLEECKTYYLKLRDFDKNKL